MDLLTQIMEFGDLPQWVQSRLIAAVKETRDNPFEYYIEYINEDTETKRNNSGLAWFVTPKELIKVTFLYYSFTIEKTKLSELIEAIKIRDFSPVEDIDAKEIKTKSCQLRFKWDRNISLNPPRLDGTDNNRHYEKFIARF